MSGPAGAQPFEPPFDDSLDGSLDGSRGAADRSAGASGWTGEAERIVAGVQGWLTEAAQGAHGGLATGAPTCGVCPVCRAVEAIRTADPALLAAGLEVATSAALSIADVLKRAADELLDVVTNAAAPSAGGTERDGTRRDDAEPS